MMTANSGWAAALQQLSVNGAHLSAEELVDTCLLIMLSERVHVLALDPELEAPQLLARSLCDLGYQVGTVGVPPAVAASAVAASDTVVAFLGPDTAADVTSVRSVRATGAVLIAITTPDADRVSTLADAVITLPSTAAPANGPLERMMFDLLASMVVAAIGRELTVRLPHGPASLPDDSTFSDFAPHHASPAQVNAMSAGRG